MSLYTADWTVISNNGNPFIKRGKTSKVQRIKSTSVPCLLYTNICGINEPKGKRRSIFWIVCFVLFAIFIFTISSSSWFLFCSLQLNLLVTNWFVKKRTKVQLKVGLTLFYFILCDCLQSMRIKKCKDNVKIQGLLPTSQNFCLLRVVNVGCHK